MDAIGTSTVTGPQNAERALLLKIQGIDPQNDWEEDFADEIVAKVESTATKLVVIGSSAAGPALIEVGYIADPKENLYRASVDVFFEGAVRLFRGAMTGALLSGMGRDGARRIKILRDAGCHTIAQDKSTSVVYGIPKAAAPAQYRECDSAEDWTSV